MLLKEGKKVELDEMGIQDLCPLNVSNLQKYSHELVLTSLLLHCSPNLLNNPSLLPNQNNIIIAIIYIKKKKKKIDVTYEDIQFAIKLGRDGVDQFLSLCA